MSGFFVSNSFGTFNSESSKVFNSVSLVGFPDGVTSISGRKMREQMRTATTPNKYLHNTTTTGNKKGVGWAHQYDNTWIEPSNNVFFNRWTGNDAAVMRDDENLVCNTSVPPRMLE